MVDILLELFICLWKVFAPKQVQCAHAKRGDNALSIDPTLPHPHMTSLQFTFRLAPEEIWYLNEPVKLVFSWLLRSLLSHLTTWPSMERDMTRQCHVTLMAAQAIF
eukprot:c5564_g2_i1 orf=174-491(-)